MWLFMDRGMFRLYGFVPMLEFDMCVSCICKLGICGVKLWE